MDYGMISILDINFPLIKAFNTVSCHKSLSKMINSFSRAEELFSHAYSTYSFTMRLKNNVQYNVLHKIVRLKFICGISNIFENHL